jgi:hypothetical protein
MWRRLRVRRQLFPRQLRVWKQTHECALSEAQDTITPLTWWMHHPRLLDCQ